MATFNHRSVAAIIGLVFASVKHLPRRVVKRGIKSQCHFLRSMALRLSLCFFSPTFFFFFHFAAHRKAYTSRVLTTTRDIFKPFPPVVACKLMRERNDSRGKLKQTTHYILLRNANGGAAL